jgi:hypothetical protein
LGGRIVDALKDRSGAFSLRISLINNKEQKYAGIVVTNSRNDQGEIRSAKKTPPERIPRPPAGEDCVSLACGFDL